MVFYKIHHKNLASAILILMLWNHISIFSLFISMLNRNKEGHKLIAFVIWINNVLDASWNAQSLVFMIGKL